MSKFTKKALAMFRTIATRCSRDALQGAFCDAEGRVCACDAFIAVRLFVDVPADVPRVEHSSITAAIVGMIDAAKQKDYIFSASFPRADHHGEKPVIIDNLRAYKSWARAHECINAYFPVGDAFFDAGRLADLACLLPDAVLYTLPGAPLQPLYAKGENGEAILLPCRTSPDTARAMLASWREAQQAQPAQTKTEAPVCTPAHNPDTPPASIRDAVRSTPETPVKLIGYKSDGNTVCIHRVQAHHVVDNVYVYATKPDQYGTFAWQFVSMFACGYALKLDARQDCERYANEPDANGNRTVFHYCESFSDDGADYSLVDYLRKMNACFADDGAFMRTLNQLMHDNKHVPMSFVRLLQEMGDLSSVVQAVLEYREKRRRAQEEAEKVREAARIEAEQQEEQQRQQEHAQALRECRAVLLSDGERMPIDGATLCELAASVGVPVSLKLKGWIMNKLATVTIEDGRMVMYQYNRQKKTEKGSTAFWPFMHAVLEALHQQEQQQEQPEQSAQEETPEEVASAEELAHLFAQTNTPTLENQPENLENSPEPDVSACIPSDALQRLAGLSSGTLSTLMRQKGQPDDDKYKAIEAFHQRILFVAQSLAPVEDETWMQLFERAYSVAYTPAAALDERDPLPAPAQNDTQENTQDAAPEAGSVIASGAYTPKFQNQGQNPSMQYRNGCTSPVKHRVAHQIDMRELLRRANTS